MADTVEGLIGAAYLDGGMDAAIKIVEFFELDTAYAS